MLSMLISIESILYILFLEKYFFLKFINTAPTTIYRCMEIERCIQDEANAVILGADSAESSHSCDNGDSALSEVLADDAFDCRGGW